MKSNKSGHIKTFRIALAVLFSALLFSTQSIAENQAGKPKQDESASKTEKKRGASSSDSPERYPFFAKVGKHYVTWMEYDYKYAQLAGKEFYHAKPTEHQLAAFQRKVADLLVTDTLLIAEAKRRNIKPDDESIKQKLALFEQRYANDPKWEDARPRVLPVITKRYENENLLSQLEEKVRDIPAPNEKQLIKYYKAHQDKFISPVQQRVSTILLRVDPGAPDSDWLDATEQAKGLVKRIRDGEDFAEMAKKYSGDITAEDGGDMGYLHEGMLPGLPSLVISKLQPGETSDPITLMEGVTIFRLTARENSKVSSFKSVRDRVQDLWLVEQSDLAWSKLIKKLKKEAQVKMDETRFYPLTDDEKEANK